MAGIQLELLVFTHDDDDDSLKDSNSLTVFYQPYT